MIQNPDMPCPVDVAGSEYAGDCFLVAGNGLFLQKRTDLFTTLVKVNGVGFLPDLKAETKFTAPRIPAGLTARIKLFFHLVCNRYQAEACVLLLFDPVAQKYAVKVPAQRVSGASVIYDRRHHSDVWLQVGTIHSHNDFGAFHSHTDSDDERYFDGLHCTFGHNDQEAISVTSSMVVNGVRTTLPPENVFAGLVSNGERFHLDSNLTPEQVQEVASWLRLVNEWHELPKVTGDTVIFTL